MAISATVIDAMLAAGCTAEQLAAVVKADLAEQEARKAEKRINNAERQQRFRDRRNGRKAPRNTDNANNALRDVTPPNEYISNPPVSPSPDGEAPHDFSEKLVEAWNIGAKAGLREARKLTGQRLTKLRTRRKAFTDAELLEAVGNLAQSAFHCGGNDRGWQASIGWFLEKDENVAKSLELKPSAPRPNRGEPASFLDHYIAKQQRAGP